MPITVFIADDHPIVREGLSALLAAQPGMQVVGTAANGRDTLTQVQRIRPQVVIMDIGMPEMNGIETARQLGVTCPEVRIVMLSMHSSAEHVFHALEAGAQGYLLKESAAMEVADAVRTVRAGRRYLSRKVAEIVSQRVSDRPGVSPLTSLSPRERQILQLVAEGSSSARIAAVLHLSPKTVDTYRSRLMQKLNISDVVGVVKFALQHGLTSLESAAI